jgi:CheY-like chemotaxis protein
MNNTVLIVDDDEDLGASLSAMVAGQGYTPVRAANGKEALKWVRQQRPRVIVTDLAMPVMNGMDLLRALRSDERDRDIPVIVMTGTNDTMMSVRVNAPVIYKPDFDQLFALIERYGDRHLDQGAAGKAGHTAGAASAR